MENEITKYTPRDLGRGLLRTIPEYTSPPFEDQAAIRVAMQVILRCHSSVAEPHRVLGELQMQENRLAFRSQHPCVPGRALHISQNTAGVRRGHRRLHGYIRHSHIPRVFRRWHSNGTDISQMSLFRRKRSRYLGNTYFLPDGIILLFNYPLM